MIGEAHSLLQNCLVTAIRWGQKDFAKHHRFAAKQAPPHFQEAFSRSLEQSYGSSLTVLKDAAVRFKEKTPSRHNQRSPAKARTSFRSSSAMAATASGSGDDLQSTQSTGQQSPLASQRAKQTDAPSEANRTGRFGRYFTLGYKEGFYQWVSLKQLEKCLKTEINELVVGKCSSSGRRTCCHVIRSIP